MIMKIAIIIFAILFLLYVIGTFMKIKAIQYYEGMREDVNIKKEKEIIEECNRRLDILRSNKIFINGIRIKYLRYRESFAKRNR